MLKLIDCEFNKRYFIEKIDNDVSQRLNSLGFFVGTKIIIINRMKTCIMVEILHIKFALENIIANKIWVGEL